MEGGRDWEEGQTAQRPFVGVPVGPHGPIERGCRRGSPSAAMHTGHQMPSEPLSLCSGQDDRPRST